jgi:hypothetical protein
MNREPGTVTDPELRAMIRESIARQLGRPETDRVLPDTAYAATDTRAGHVRLQQDLTRHGGFVRLALPSGGDGDGACLIEPSVRCNHCGYCQSYGH